MFVLQVNILYNSRLLIYNPLDKLKSTAAKSKNRSCFIVCVNTGKSKDSNFYIRIMPLCNNKPGYDDI